MTLPSGWEHSDDDTLRGILAELEHLARLKRQQDWKPYPWQEPRREDGTLWTPQTQGMWLMLGGRGTGKTDGAARYVDQHMNGPACDLRLNGGHRIAIIAPTLGDAVEACVTGPSGLKAHNPAVDLRGGTGGTFVRWRNGAEGKLFGASTPADVERLRAGGNRCLVWLEEVAAQRYLKEVLEHSRFGLRLGPRPHYVGSTTPKPRKEIRALLADPRTFVTRGRTRDAIHLDPSVREELERRYAGTRLGRQELDGEILTDVEGALWTWAQMDAPGFRLDPTDPAINDTLATYTRGCVAVDPAVTSGEDSDATALVAACSNGQAAIVLASLAMRRSPLECMTAAVNLAIRCDLDSIVIERNNGGDYLKAVCQQVQKEHPDPRARLLRVVTVVATRGKTLRAQPVAGVYEQQRVQHLGRHDELEAEMTSWVDDPRQASPNLLDALVWALTHLLINGRAIPTAKVIRT